MNTEPNLEPLNTEWNRKTGILSGKGEVHLFGIKHGIAYFVWTDLEKNLTYLQCDEHVMKRHFKLFSKKTPGNEDNDTDEVIDALRAKKTRFLKYPFDMVV